MEGLIFNIQKFSLHDGDGIRTSVFFQGCNLRCKWCANPESFEMRGGEAKSYTVEVLMAELIKDKPFYEASGGGITLTGGEPLLQAEFVCALCNALTVEGIGIVMETAAHAAPHIFKEVLEKCDAAYIDLKHYNNEAHMRGTGVQLTNIFSNIRIAAASGIPTTVRIPIIPGFNNLPEDMDGFASRLNQLGQKEVHLLPFHQLGEHKYKKLNIPYEYANTPSLYEEDLESFAKVLKRAGISVQIG